MGNTAKNDKPVPKRKEGETLKEKIRRHFSDKDDIITNEDIRDIRVGEVPVPALEKENEKIADEISKDKKITPWDILDEE